MDGFVIIQFFPDANFIYFTKDSSIFTPEDTNTCSPKKIKTVEFIQLFFLYEQFDPYNKKLRKVTYESEKYVREAYIGRVKLFYETKEKIRSPFVLDSMNINGNYFHFSQKNRIDVDSAIYW